MSKPQSTNLRAAETARNTFPIYLYVITSGTTIIYATCCDQNVTVTGGTAAGFSDPQVFNSMQIKHSQFQEDVDSKSGAISVALAADNPILKSYFVASPPNKVTIQVYRTNLPSQTVSPTVTFADIYLDFSGQCTTVTFKGFVIEGSFVPEILMEDQLLPKYFFQRECNYILGSKFCTVDLTPWTANVTVTNPNRVDRTIDVVIATINGKAITNETYQGGRIVDAAGNKIGIMAGKILSHIGFIQTMRFYLNWWPNPQAGDTIALTVGCLKIPRICDQFFGNIDNYGATPCIPITNPTMNGIAT